MTEHLTDERLAELRKIAEETRPGGGWTADVYQVNDEDGHQVYGADAYGDGTSPAAEHIAAFDPPTVLALLAEVERLRTLHKDRAALIRAVSAAQDAGDDAGIELTRSDLNPIVRAALSAALGGEQR